MAPHPKITELRQKLAERFPEAHRQAAPHGDSFRTGLPCLDTIGLPKGGITELVSSRPSTGSPLLLAGLMESATRNRYPWALVDGADAFDPQSLGQKDCRELLWVRCHKAHEAIKATDLLLRDGNLPLTVVDLQLSPAKELRRIRNSVWFRLQSLVQHTSTVCLMLTPYALVGSARLRLECEEAYHFQDLERPQTALLEQMQFRVARRRGPSPPKEEE